jgi:hypothetical protein
MSILRPKRASLARSAMSMSPPRERPNVATDGGNIGRDGRCIFFSLAIAFCLSSSAPRSFCQAKVLRQVRQVTEKTSRPSVAETI